MNHQSIDLFLAEKNVQRSQLLGKESSAAWAGWAPVATQGLGCSQPTYGINGFLVGNSTGKP